MRVTSRLGLAVALLCVAATTSCCGEKPTYPDGVVPVSLTEIVSKVTKSRVRALGSREALATQVSGFIAGNPRFEDRATLAAAWTDLGEPASKLDLQTKVFDTATEDGNWAENVAEAYPDGKVPDQVFVMGFLDGLQAFTGGSNR